MKLIDKILDDYFTRRLYYRIIDNLIAYNMDIKFEITHDHCDIMVKRLDSGERAYVSLLSFDKRNASSAAVYCSTKEGRDEIRKRVIDYFASCREKGENAK